MVATGDTVPTGETPDMRVIWLSNRPLSDSDDGGSGTWLWAMARGLLDSGSIELGIIAPDPVREVTRRAYLQVKQWIVPSGIVIGHYVLLVGAGAYSLPLVAHAKRMGKQGVHLGGAAQVLFGIRGRRWEGQPESCFYNEHWSRPIPEETPAGVEAVEGGCYW